MAYPTSGGLSSTSIFNQGKTPINKQVTASESIKDTQVRDMFLATNYTKTGSLANANFFDALLADWYRYGKAATEKDKVYDRNPKTVNPMDFEEPAALRVFGKKSKKSSGTKSGDVELIPPFTKFILEGSSEAHTERSQIVETFGSFYVFMFGERPPMYNFSGTLINAKDINWRQDFQFYYDNYLRGTKCVENNARLVMTYGGRQIEGFMLNFQTQTDAAIEMGVKVSFQLVVTNRLATLNLSEDFGSLVNSAGIDTGNTQLIELLNNIAGAEGKGLSSTGSNAAYSQVKEVVSNGKGARGGI